MSESDPPEAAVSAAVAAGRAYSGGSDHELARVMLRAALPHLGTGKTTHDLNSSQVQIAGEPHHEYRQAAKRVTGFGPPNAG